MASYQDIETRLRTLEAKTEFVMKSFSVSNPLEPFSQPKTLLDMYYIVMAANVIDSAPTEPAQEVEIHVTD